MDISQLYLAAVKKHKEQVKPSNISWILLLQSVICLRFSSTGQYVCNLLRRFLCRNRVCVELLESKQFHVTPQCLQMWANKIGVI